MPCKKCNDFHEVPFISYKIPYRTTVGIISGVITHIILNDHEAQNFPMVESVTMTAERSVPVSKKDIKYTRKLRKGYLYITMWTNVINQTLF